MKINNRLEMARASISFTAAMLLLVSESSFLNKVIISPLICLNFYLAIDIICNMLKDETNE